MPRDTSVAEGRGRVTYTRGGLAGAMKGRTLARQCERCGLGFPTYVGRYPIVCPQCKGAIVVVEGNDSAVITCISKVPRLQRIIDAGAPAEAPDGRCSRASIVHYEDIARRLPGGLSALTTFMEGPVRGRYFRVEHPQQPVIILELDDDLERARLFSSEDPKAHLGIDPRTEFVDTDPIFEAKVLREAGGVSWQLPRGAPQWLASAMDMSHRILAKRGYTVGAGNGYAFRVGYADIRRTLDVDVASKFVSVTDPMRRDGTATVAVYDPDTKREYKRRVTADAISIVKAVRSLLGESVIAERSGFGGIPHQDVPGGNRMAQQAHMDATHEDRGRTRGATSRPRKPGDGMTTPMGGFRIHVGAARSRKPRKDISRSMQQKRNARRGLAKRTKAAKEWHRSPEGERLHKALGRYNVGRGSGEATRKKMAASAPQVAANLTEGLLGALVRSWRPNQHLLEATLKYAETIDDVLDDILRKLLVIEALDVLQDVEFDEETGSVYLFFDPTLPGDEIAEMAQMLQNEYKDLALVASPDRSLPHEQVESDWWVMFLPRTTQEGVMPMADPSVYASEDQPPPGPQMKQQIVVMAPVDQAGELAQDIDLDAIMSELGESTQAALRQLPTSVQARIAARMNRSKA